jgi:hypothetical protein
LAIDERLHGDLIVVTGCSDAFAQRRAVHGAGTNRVTAHAFTHVVLGDRLGEPDDREGAENASLQVTALTVAPLTGYVFVPVALPEQPTGSP